MSRVNARSNIYKKTEYNKGVLDKTAYVIASMRPKQWIKTASFLQD